MSELPPDWAFEIYSKLWVNFEENDFTNKDASKLIKDKTLNQGLSFLKKTGWLGIRLNPNDARKSIYKLKNPKDTIMEIITTKRKEEKKDSK